MGFGHDLKLLTLILQSQGFGVISCTDGMEAVQALLVPKGKNIVAVFSDLMMPKVNGLGLLKRIRDGKEYKNLPFVLQTSGNSFDKNEIKLLKITSILQKPITSENVAFVLKEFFVP